MAQLKPLAPLPVSSLSLWQLLLLLTALLPRAGHCDSGFGLPPLQYKDSPGAIALGRDLFLDRRLSVNNTLSCAMCHIPEQGFAQNELATSVGLEGRAIKRNAPTLLNIAYMDRLFHDGREMTLENQIWSPLLSEREMGNHSVGLVLRKVTELPGYRSHFEREYGSLDIMTLGSALAAYQRSLVAGDSGFDRWYFGKDENAVSEDAKTGFGLFRRHGCAGCHTIGDDHALFTDQQFHNTGIGYERSMETKPGTRIVKLAETITIETEEAFEGEVFNDLGRYEVTGKPEDRWRYRTPTLRNLALTAPYMHDGSMPSLHEVLEYYIQGGFGGPNQTPQIQPITLDEQEKRQLLAFLDSLTSPHIAALVNATRP